MWPQLIFFLVSLVVQIATTPKPKSARPAAFSDFDLPQSAEGTAEQWVFGDVWIKDWTLVGVGNFRTAAIKTKSGK